MCSIVSLLCIIFCPIILGLIACFYLDIDIFAFFEGKWLHKTVLDVDKNPCLKVASHNTSHLEAHAGFFRLLVKRIFNP